MSFRTGSELPFKPYGCGAEWFQLSASACSRLTWDEFYMGVPGDAESVKSDLKRYDSSMLVSLKRAALTGVALCFAVCSASGATGETAWHDHGLLRLKAIQFDPLRGGVPELAARLPNGVPLRPKNGSTPPLWIQLDRPWTQQDRTRFAQIGLRFLGSIPDHAAIVRPPAGLNIDTLRTLPGVRSVGEFEAGFKFGPDLHDRLQMKTDEVSVQLTVSLFSDAAPEAIALAVERTFESVVINRVRRIDPPQIQLSVPGNVFSRLVAALVRDPDVQFVEPIYGIELHNDQVVWITQSYNRVAGPLEAAEALPRTYAQSATIWNQGLHGEGQIVAIADTGFETGTCFFNDFANGVTPQAVAPPGNLLTDASHRKIVALNGVTPTALTSSDAFRHGSHVATTLAGDDQANLADSSTPGHDHGDGVAPAARMVLEDISVAVDSACGVSIGVNSVEDLLAQEYAAGARISNNSWGGLGPTYGNAAQGIDRAIHDREDFLVVFSAGNDGTAGITGTAQCKNCVVVGASENYDAVFQDAFGGLDPENMTRFSGVGPAGDGRLRPDVVAPGYLVYSNRFPVQYISDAGDPQCAGDLPDVCLPSFGGCYLIDTSASCSVNALQGTSMSTPIIAGLGTLARQYMVDGFYPGGAANPTDGQIPSAALLKALLINGARNMTGRRYQRGGTPVDRGPLADAPSFIQGWGRTVLDDALYFAGDSRRLRLVDRFNNQGLATGQTDVSQHRVTDTSEPLKFTLAWTDPPALPAAGAALVNDLTLFVTAPDGTTYFGNAWTSDDINVINDVQSRPNPFQRDSLNNVEGVFLLTPQIGVYTATVVGVNIPGDVESMTQGFALVITGSVVGPAAPPMPDGTVGTALTASRNDVSGGSIDVTYDTATCSAAEYQLLFGPLGSVNLPTVTGSQCDLGDSGNANWTTVPPGDLWFIVVTGNGEGLEGRWGMRTDGLPRDDATASGECGGIQLDTSSSCPE